MSNAGSTRISGHQGVREQCSPHVGGGLPARLAGLGEGFHHGIAERARHIAPELAQIGGWRVLLHIEHSGCARGGKRRAPRERLEQHDAKGIEIRTAVDVRRAARLLRTHVLLGANEEAAAGAAVLARAGDRSGGSKIDTTAPPPSADSTMLSGLTSRCASPWSWA